MPFSEMLYPDYYRIMQRYLDAVYFTDETQEMLGALCGQLDVDANGIPFDTAHLYDWNKAVSALELDDLGSESERARRAAVAFLELWLGIGFNEEIAGVCEDLKNKLHRDLWDAAVKEVLA